MLTVWSVRGGEGCTVIALGLIAALQGRAGSPPILAVDLRGDLGSMLAGSLSDGPGVSEWLEAGAGAATDALARLERSLGPGLVLIPRGTGSVPLDRVDALVARLVDEDRPVVVDAGRLSGDHPSHPLIECATRSLLVVRACPFSLERVRKLTASPSGVVVVRDRGRTLRRDAFEAAAGAPVVAEVQVDPGIGASMDRGLLRRPLPRPFVRAMGSIA